MCDLDVIHGGSGTLLTEAALHGSHACVSALLKAGAAVDRIDGRGTTALMCAAMKGHVQVVRVLLKPIRSLHDKNKKVHKDN